MALAVSCYVRFYLRKVNVSHDEAYSWNVNDLSAQNYDDFRETSKLMGYRCSNYKGIHYPAYRLIVSIKFRQNRRR